MANGPDFEDEPPAWWLSPEEFPMTSRKEVRDGKLLVGFGFASRAAAKNCLGFFQFISDPRNRPQIEADLRARPKWAPRTSETLTQLLKNL